MEKLRNFMSKVFTIWGYVGLACCCFMCILVVVDVVCRTVFKIGIVGATELAQMMLIGMMPLGAICLLEGRDIKMDIVVHKFKEFQREIIITISYLPELFILVMLCIMTFKGSEYQIKYNTTFSMLGVPQWPFFWLLAVCYGLCAISVAVLVILQVDKLRKISAERKTTKLKGGESNE